MERRNISGMSSALLLTAGVVFAADSSATSGPPWDGKVTGTISQIDTVANEPGNSEVRIYLGGATVCTTSAPNMQGFAYFNSTDNNFKGTLANLMLAYSLGKYVEIYTLNDNGAGCHIHYVMVRG